MWMLGKSLIMFVEYLGFLSNSDYAPPEQVSLPINGLRTWDIVKVSGGFRYYSTFNHAGQEIDSFLTELSVLRALILTQFAQDLILQFPKPMVCPSIFYQLMMRTALHNFAVIYHNDFIHVFKPDQTMCNEQACFTMHDLK